MRRRYWWIALTSAMLALPVVGCGGGGEMAVRVSQPDDEEEAVPPPAPPPSATPAPAPAAAEKPPVDSTPKPPAPSETGKGEAVASTASAVPKAPVPTEPPDGKRNEAPKRPDGNDAPKATVASSGRPAQRPTKKPSAAPRVAPEQAPLPAPSTVTIQTTPINRDTPDADLLNEAILRFRKVALALDAYAIKNGHYPAAATETADGVFVSWRVEILGELGYPEVLALYDRKKPWDSEVNKKFLDRIPPEFQAPHRADHRTNFLAVKGRGCAFRSGGPVPRSAFFDGVGTTILLVESDDDNAVPWTSPADHDFRTVTPSARLGKLRTGGFLAAWGDGEIRRIELSTTKDKLAAPFTIAGGETIALATLTKRPDAVVERSGVVLAVADAGEKLFADLAAALGSSTPTMNDVPETGDQPTDERWPIPETAELENAKKQLKQLYKDEIAKATGWTKKAELAKKMFDEADTYLAEPPAFHAMLTSVRGVAVSMGDYALASTAVERLASKFKIDEVEERRKLVEEFRTKIKPDHYDLYAKDVETVVERSIAGDDHTAAKNALEALLGAMKRAGKDAAEMKKIQARLELLDDRRRAYAKVIEARRRLKESPGDPEANTTIGVYLAVYKGEWDKGLPLLAKGSDARLKLIAGVDLGGPVEPAQMLDLGDLYWEVGEKKEKLPRRSLLARGAYWYQRCVLQLPQNLARARAEKRLLQLKTELTEPVLEEMFRTMTVAPVDVQANLPSG